MPQQDIVSGIVFLGCWVKRCAATFGINSTPTTIDIDLVPGQSWYPEDVNRMATGFDYVNAEPGKMSGLSIGKLDFQGIIQSWTESYGPDGQIYNVRMADPRLIFPNIPLILDGQGLGTGFTIDNYLNVFSYYGNPADADSTEQGMAFRTIRNFLSTTGIINVYGKPMILEFASGFQDGTGDINPSGIPHWYRINANQITLDQLLQQVTSDLGMDYYTSLSYNPTGTSILKVNPIFRTAGSVTGQVNAVIDDWSNRQILLGYHRGQELRSEPTTSVSIGPQLTYWTTPEVSQIQNVWGRSDDGTIITTEYDDQSGIILLDNITGSGTEVLINTVTIPSIIVQKTTGADIYPPQTQRTFTVQDVIGYKAGPNVMRAALYSQESWEAMLFKEQPAFASQIGIQRQRIRDETNLVNQTQEIIQALRLSIIGSGITDRTDITEFVIKAVYEATRATVDENYGRHWLVQLGTSQWLVNGSYNSSELLPRIEFEPAPAAWSQAISSPSGATLNHPNLQITTNPTLKDQVGRLRSFLSIPNYNTQVENTYFPYPIDLSAFSRDAVFIESQGDKLVIPIQVEAYDKDPDRAMVTTTVPLEGITGASGYMEKTPYYNFLLAMGYSDDNIRKYNLMANSDDSANLGLAPPRPYRLPVSNDVYGFFIALQSNVKPFGGFVASGTVPGGVRIINDSSLGPWTYGNYNNFNAAGQQLANRSVAVATTIDTADFSLAGLPEQNLGDIIGQSALITSLSIQYSAEGVTTNYQLRTFALPSIRISKLLTDKITNVYSKLYYQHRSVVDISKELKYQAAAKKKLDGPVHNIKDVKGALDKGKNEEYGYMVSLVVPSTDGVSP